MLCARFACNHFNDLDQEIAKKCDKNCSVFRDIPVPIPNTVVKPYRAYKSASLESLSLISLRRIFGRGLSSFVNAWLSIARL